MPGVRESSLTINKTALPKNQRHQWQFAQAFIVAATISSSLFPILAVAQLCLGVFVHVLQRETWIYKEFACQSVEYSVLAYLRGPTELILCWAILGRFPHHILNQQFKGYSTVCSFACHKIKVPIHTSSCNRRTWGKNQFQHGLVLQVGQHDWVAWQTSDRTIKNTSLVATQLGCWNSLRSLSSYSLPWSAPCSTRPFVNTCSTVQLIKFNVPNHWILETTQLQAKVEAWSVLVESIDKSLFDVSKTATLTTWLPYTMHHISRHCWKHWL